MNLSVSWILLWVLPVTTGCVTGLRPTAEDRRESFKPFSEVTIEDIPISDFLITRLSFVYSEDRYPVEWEVQVNEDEGNATFTLTGDRKGLAAPVSQDGLYVTAAHIVGQDTNVGVLHFNIEERTLVKMPANVVFLNEQLDLAVLKTAKKPPSSLRWFSCSTSSLRSGEGVVVIQPSEDGGFLAGGKIVALSPNRIGPETQNVEFSQFTASLPITKGASGSPVVDLQGNLQGVLTKGQFVISLVPPPKPLATAKGIAFDQSFIAWLESQHTH